MLGGDISTSIGATGGLAEAGVTAHVQRIKAHHTPASGEVCPELGEAVDGRPVGSSGSKLTSWIWFGSLPSLPML